MSENRRNPLRNLALAGAGSVLALLFALAQDGAAQRPGAGSRTVRGVVDRFTTAKKGEVDGCVLEDGTWVHWPPHQGERVAPLLAKGDRIRVTGRTEIGKKGESKFEAELIVNLRTDRAITLDEDGPGTPPLREAAGGREERLRALERRLDELLREVRQFRRQK